jgi:hypothetical protein
MKFEWIEGNCRKCSAWLCNLNHSELRYCPEKEYPVNLQPTKVIDGNVEPKMLTFNNIKKGVFIYQQHLKKKKFLQLGLNHI